MSHSWSVPAPAGWLYRVRRSSVARIDNGLCASSSHGVLDAPLASRGFAASFDRWHARIVAVARRSSTTQTVLCGPIVVNTESMIPGVDGLLT